MFSPAGNCSELCFDPSDEEESRETNVADCVSLFLTDKSCNKTSHVVKFPSNSWLDEDKYTDQQILDQHFQSCFSELVTNQNFQCEEFLASDQFDVMSEMTTRRQGSDCIYLSHPDTQGELKFDLRSSLNKVEYEYFVSPLDSMEPSYVYDDSQFDYIHEHADIQFHSRKSEESMSSFDLHYESDDDSFILPNKVIRRSDVLGKIKETQIFRLPQVDVNENQFFDRGRKL